MTSMLATAHGSEAFYEETLSTLRYAASIKKIKTVAKRNSAGGKEGEAKSAETIAQLRAEVGNLPSRRRPLF